MLIIVVFILAVAVYFFAQLPSAGETDIAAAPREAMVRINEAVFRVEVADTPALRGQGLSGRAALASDRGMLFVFPASGAYRFTMNGMRFPLDFIWIQGGRVVGITENAAPETQVVEPPALVDRVLEITAGEAARRGIEAGDEVRLE